MREFRLPQKNVRDTMSVKELEDTAVAYLEWYYMNEEGMTLAQADKCYGKYEELVDYIAKRTDASQLRQDAEEINAKICLGHTMDSAIQSVICKE